MFVYTCCFAPPLLALPALTGWGGVFCLPPPGKNRAPCGGGGGRTLPHKGLEIFWKGCYNGKERIVDGERHIQDNC